jgi:hypothetical protein
MTWQRAVATQYPDLALPAYRKLRSWVMLHLRGADTSRLGMVWIASPTVLPRVDSLLASFGPGSRQERTQRQLRCESARTGLRRRCGGSRQGRIGTQGAAGEHVECALGVANLHGICTRHEPAWQAHRATERATSFPPIPRACLALQPTQRLQYERSPHHPARGSRKARSRRGHGVWVSGPLLQGRLRSLTPA